VKASTEYIRAVCLVHKSGANCDTALCLLKSRPWTDCCGAKCRGVFDANCRMAVCCRHHIPNASFLNLRHFAPLNTLPLSVNTATTPHHTCCYPCLLLCCHACCCCALLCCAVLCCHVCCALLCRAVLCCCVCSFAVTVLCCAVLCCAVLCCALLCRAVLCCHVCCFAVLCCAVFRAADELS